MSKITRATAPNSSNPRNWFLDENGQPSNHRGVDLSTEPPIEEIITAIEALSDAAEYAIAFRVICSSYGIDLQLLWTPDEEADSDGLRFGYPFDIQVAQRKPRFDQLVESLDREPERRDALISLLFASGHFNDCRPYETAQEAIDAYLAVGGRIIVDPKGKLDCPIDAGLLLRHEAIAEDRAAGWPRRIAAHRMLNSEHRHRAALIAAAMADGEALSNGWYELKRQPAAAS